MGPSPSPSGTGAALSVCDLGDAVAASEADQRFERRGRDRTVLVVRVQRARGVVDQQRRHDEAARSERPAALDTVGELQQQHPVRPDLEALQPGRSNGRRWPQGDSTRSTQRWPEASPRPTEPSDRRGGSARHCAWGRPRPRADGRGSGAPLGQNAQPQAAEHQPPVPARQTPAREPRPSADAQRPHLALLAGRAHPRDAWPRGSCPVGGRAVTRRVRSAARASGSAETDRRRSGRRRFRAGRPSASPSIALLDTRAHSERTPRPRRAAFP
jgi:hypothetical protein